MTCICNLDEDKPLSVREHVWLQEFPDDWEFVISMQKYRMIGKVVPI